MKINVEVDMTPEELRKFMGLPDVEGVQKQMLDGFAETLQSSQEQRDEFLRSLYSGAVAPWQNFLQFMTGATINNDHDK